MNRSKQRARLTRAINTQDAAKIRAAVKQTVSEWDEWGMWPDDWHRENIALQDTVCFPQTIDIESI